MEAEPATLEKVQGEVQLEVNHPTEEKVSHQEVQLEVNYVPTDTRPKSKEEPSLHDTTQVEVEEPTEPPSVGCHVCPRVGNMAFVSCICPGGWACAPMMGPHWPCTLVVWAITVVLVGVWMLLVVPWVDSTGLSYASYGIGPLAVCALFCTSCGNPGMQLESWRPKNESERKRGRWCTRCEILQEPDTRHCSDCGVCVRGHDHHCPVMGQCIGGANLLWFKLFVTCAILFPCLLIATVIAGLVMHT